MNNNNLNNIGLTKSMWLLGKPLGTGFTVDCQFYESPLISNKWKHNK